MIDALFTRIDAQGSTSSTPFENGSTLTYQSDNVDQPLLATQKEKKDYVRERKVATLADRGTMEPNLTEQV
jgi:hypothetical protein